MKRRFLFLYHGRLSCGGPGLAGISFCEPLKKQGRSFKVINDDSNKLPLWQVVVQSCILKRFTLAWKADEQLNWLMPFYSKLEEKLGSYS